MSQQSTSKARVIDPILTAVAQGYTNNDFVGNRLFPVVSVAARAGHVIKFGREDFLLYNTRRAPGQNTRRVQFGRSEGKFSLADHSLEGAVPIEIEEESAAVPGIDEGSRAVRKVQNIMALGVEFEQATLARDASKYANENKIVVQAGDKWTTPDSDPINMVSDGIEAIRRKIGKRPNTAVIGASVFKALKVHPQIIERIKYTGRDVPTRELIASLFEIDELLVGEAVFSTDGKTITDVWGGDVVLAYTETASLAEQGSPSYGYTYQLEGYSVVEQPYFDRNPKTWFYPVTDAREPQLVGPDGGFLIKGAA